MQPTILLIRHGNTTYDDKVDALLDPPLTHDGVERIKRTAEALNSFGFKYKRIVTTPLQRGLKAAQIISGDNHPIYPDNDALPWNLGDLMGKETKQVESVIEHLENYPDLKAPHGESYRTFFNRWNNLVQRMLLFVEAKADEALVVVTHSRNIDALHSIINGAPIGDVVDPAPEGSITKLSSPNTGSWEYHRIWEGK